MDGDRRDAPGLLAAPMSGVRRGRGAVEQPRSAALMRGAPVHRPSTRPQPQRWLTSPSLIAVCVLHPCPVTS